MGTLRRKLGRFNFRSRLCLFLRVRPSVVLSFTVFGFETGKSNIRFKRSVDSFLLIFPAVFLRLDFDLDTPALSCVGILMASVAKEANLW